jgi:hypothetical protein
LSGNIDGRINRSLTPPEQACTMASINRFNQFNYSSYDRLQWQKSRRADAAAQQARTSALANNFASIQTNLTMGQGNLFSRIAMSRMSKTA